MLKVKAVVHTITTSILHIFHTALVIVGLWTYMITYFGLSDHIDIIPWYISAYNFSVPILLPSCITAGAN
jgi:hypothetical protein